MLRSGPKPKIIYKNLQQMIKTSYIRNNYKTTPRKQLENHSNHYQFKKKSTHSEEKIKKQNYRSQKQTNICKQNELNFKDRNFISIQKKCKQEKLIERLLEDGQDQYSKYYHQVDVIYTELQDKLFQSKQQLLNHIRNAAKLKHPPETIIYKVQQTQKMADYIKHIHKYFSEEEQKILISHSNTNNNGNSNNHVQKNRKQYTIPSDEDNINEEKQFYKPINTEHSDYELHQLILQHNTKIKNRRKGAILSKEPSKTIYELILEQNVGKNIKINN